MRVQVPAYTDRWMRGDRYGVVVRVVTRKEDGVEFVYVKLDKSGVTMKFLSDDCKDV